MGEQILDVDIKPLPVDTDDVITAVVDTQTSEFVDFGADLSDRYVRVVVPRNPDPLREMWSGKPDEPIVPKPPEKVAAAFEKQSVSAIPAPIRALLIHALGPDPTEAAIAAACASYTTILKGLV